jgi:hypothetical protein
MGTDRYEHVPPDADTPHTIADLRSVTVCNAPVQFIERVATSSINHCRASISLVNTRVGKG